MVKIRRILVALDASPGSLVAAEAASELAALLEAELRGLFVEDAELVRISQAPLAREVDILTGRLRPLQSDDLERQFRAQASKAREALELMARRAGVECSFRVSRGAVSQEILSEAAECDLVTLGRLGWSMRSRLLLGRTLRTLLAQGRRTLLLESLAQIASPVVILYDGSKAAREALQLGVSLTTSRKGRMRILLLGDERKPLEKEVRALTADVPDLDFDFLRALDPGKVAHFVSRHCGGLVVVPVGGRLKDEHLQVLLQTVHCPLLTVS